MERLAMLDIEVKRGSTDLFRHLPVREPDRLVAVFPAIQRAGEPQSFSYPNYVDVRDRNDVLSGLLAYQMVAVSLSRNGNNEIIWGYMATGNYFELLGVKAALGRTFTPEDDRQAGAHPVVVLSHACWQKRFGADRNIVGQTVLLNNQRYTIIGVAPPRFIGTEIIYAPEIWAPMMMVALVLLVACTNLAGLLLARAAGRRKEIAIRLSLGASRERLLRQLLTESLLLALAGGVVGTLLAVWLIGLVMAFKPPVAFPLLMDLQPDWRVLSFTVILSMLTGLLFGLLPALQATKPELVPALKDEGALGGYRRSRLRNSLVVAQVALSLVLLVAAGLVVRSLQRVRVMSPGFNPENVVALTMSLSLQGYDESKGRRFQQQIIERVQALPGVKSAAITNLLPLSLSRTDRYIFIEGAPPTRGAETPSALYSRVSAGYFQTMEIPVVEGRALTERDRADAPKVVIINETFARRFWPGQNAVGKRFRSDRADGPPLEVVGVVKDGKYLSLGEDPQPFFYLPMLQNYADPTMLLARTTNDHNTVIAQIRSEALKLDPAMPFVEVKTLTEHLSLSLFPLRIGASFVGSFGMLALLLAAIGIYGVMAFAVSQRTREIGIRMALGAKRADVLRLIIKQGLALTLAGLGLGLGGALLLTRLMSSVLYGVSATDLLTYVSVTALLCLVVLLASRTARDES